MPSLPHIFSPTSTLTPSVLLCDSLENLAVTPHLVRSLAGDQFDCLLLDFLALAVRTTQRLAYGSALGILPGT